MRKNYLDLLPPNGSSEAFGTTWSSISVPAKVKGSVISGLPIVDESTELATSLKQQKQADRKDQPITEQINLISLSTNRRVHDHCSIIISNSIIVSFNNKKSQMLDSVEWCILQLYQ